MLHDEVRRLYESGEIDRLLRFCKVRDRDFDDLKQEVAVWLLTSKEKIKKLPEYTISLIRRQYHSKKSKWYKEETRWRENKVELSHFNGEIPDTDF